MTQHTVGMFSGVCTKICLDKSYADVWMVETVTMVVLYLFFFFVVVVVFVFLFFFLSLNRLQVGSTQT